MESKVFNDSIHGHIEIHQLLVKVIDAPQFQRLRNIKQLGGCSMVYYGAVHNRFEHSIGTCHLATKLLISLKNKLELYDKINIKITDLDIFCVSLAALCHDLGHGLFSHLFENRFMKDIRKKQSALEEKSTMPIKFEHECTSFKMLEFILYQNDNNLLKEFQNEFKAENGFNREDVNGNNKDLTFIKEMIVGNKKGDLIGRPDKKYRFLYSIVSNKSCSVDVDKFDYIARDCHHLGMKSTFDHNRFIQFARVMKINDQDEYEICHRDKEVENIYELFHMRHSLHKRAYQHKTCNLIEMMVSDALVLADDHLKFYNGDKEYKLSETINDMEVYQHVTDDILQQIVRSNDINLNVSKDILQRIFTRNLYRIVTEKILSPFQEVQIEKHKTGFKDLISTWKIKILEKYQLLNESLLRFELINFNYGMGKKNPVDVMYFHKKDKKNMKVFHIKKENIDPMLPNKFSYNTVRIYFTGNINDVIKTEKLNDSEKMEEFRNFVDSVISEND